MASFCQQRVCVSVSPDDLHWFQLSRGPNVLEVPDNHDVCTAGAQTCVHGAQASTLANSLCNCCGYDKAMCWAQGASRGATLMFSYSNLHFGHFLRAAHTPVGPKCIPNPHLHCMHTLPPLPLGRHELGQWQLQRWRLLCIVWGPSWPLHAIGLLSRVEILLHPVAMGMRADNYSTTTGVMLTLFVDGARRIDRGPVT